MSACKGTWEDLDDNVAGFAASWPRMCGYQSIAMSPALSKGRVDEHRAWKQEPWEVGVGVGCTNGPGWAVFSHSQIYSFKKPYEVFTMKIINVY